MAQLSISEIRRELIRAAADYDSSGARSSAVAGIVFHEVAACLMGPQGWQMALEPGELEDAGRLAAYAYENFLGPRITQSQAALNEQGEQALELWNAVQATCQWVSGLLSKAAGVGIIAYDPQLGAWTGAEKLCQPERELQWEVMDPNWSEPVMVRGVADALWRNPESGRWCVVEYKLGQTRPEADLAQACLYHAALCASGLDSEDGAISLIDFSPQLRERFFEGAKLAEAKASLRALIGRLGRVVKGPPAEPAPAAPPDMSQAENRHVELGKKLVRVLKDYGVSVEWQGEMIAGPAFLRYSVLPSRSTSMKDVCKHAENLGMQLRLPTDPMIHKSGGRLVIDIERPDRQPVTFQSIRGQLDQAGPGGSSRVPLGTDLNGILQFVDLASPNNPHLLVAGTAGSGKSEWMRSAIAGLALANTPATLRFVLIDPKRTAFSEMKGSPFLFNKDALLYPPEHPVLEHLEALIEEMESRYKYFELCNASDLPEYQAITGHILPRIVCICDEYADLLTDKAATKELSTAIARLGAKARAAGIHLVLATQYPDSKTVNSAIKMNLAGRVCLRVANHSQSNMIINTSGAERLLGKGDLFFLSVGQPVRLQSPLLSMADRAEIFGAGRAEPARVMRS